jgi:uncharacterized protein (TIGR03000 family)
MMYARQSACFAAPALAGSLFLLSTVSTSYAQPVYRNLAGSSFVPVHIAIRVPSNAEVWFEGAKTHQAGESREFISPPLALTRAYTYQIRTRWMEGGRPVDRTHTITVQAGDRIGLDFTNGSRTQPYAYGTLSPGDENPVSIYPVLPRSSGSNQKVAPASEQSPTKGSGPPGSNDPYSLGVGQG